MKGWYNQGWRHALAAKGVRTRLRMSYAKKPLITNDEIDYINRNSDKDVSSMTDAELAGHVSKLRGNDYPKKDTVKDKILAKAKEVDWMSPLKSDVEKGNIGQMKDKSADELEKYAIAQMELKNASENPNADFIKESQIDPIINDVKLGASPKSAKEQIDSKIAYNFGGDSDEMMENPILAFSGKNLNTEETGNDWRWGGVEDPGDQPGMFNFIGQAEQDLESKKDDSEDI